MIFTLIILTSPNVNQATHTGYRFARAAVAAGHHVRQAFFYADGALAAGSARMAGDETDTVAAWAELAAQHGIELIACETAAARRGVGDLKTETRSGMLMGSLSQLMVALEGSDRVLTFA